MPSEPADTAPSPADRPLAGQSISKWLSGVHSSLAPVVNPDLDAAHDAVCDSLALYASQVGSAAAIAFNRDWLDAAVSDGMASDVAYAHSNIALARYYAATGRDLLSGQRLIDARCRLRETAAHLREILRPRSEDAPGDAHVRIALAFLEQLPPLVRFYDKAGAA